MLHPFANPLMNSKEPTLPTHQKIRMPTDGLRFVALIRKVHETASIQNRCGKYDNELLDVILKHSRQLRHISQSRRRKCPFLLNQV